MDIVDWSSEKDGLMAEIFRAEGGCTQPKNQVHWNEATRIWDLANQILGFSQSDIGI